VLARSRSAILTCYRPRMRFFVRPLLGALGFGVRRAARPGLPRYHIRPTDWRMGFGRRGAALLLLAARLLRAGVSVRTP